MKHVALVTGGSRGIGLGIAQCLLKGGFDVAICGVRTACEHKDFFYCQCDVSDAAARQRMIEAIRQRFGRLDVLVNNAGIAPKVRADILEANEESFDELIRTNLKGPYFLTQAVARWMIEQKSGCIINVSSISATVASVNRGDYCISKAGIAMATQLWAARLGAFNIPVYEVRPGVIRTDMTAPVTAKYDKLFAEGLAIQPRWGTPEDVGKVVAALARGDFPYSTGAVLMVDGGLTVQRL
ncbi:MAG: 3-ketoacyl-ACP reductase [Verrucomicrobia bacterium]|nr:3-ketoacyl-ACP reductase [Verrucomicrobiota bacterium]